LRPPSTLSSRRVVSYGPCPLVETLKRPWHRRSTGRVPPKSLASEPPAPRGRPSPGNWASALARPAVRSSPKQQACDCRSQNRGAVQRPLRIGDSPRTGLARRQAWLGRGNGVPTTSSIPCGIESCRPKEGENKVNYEQANRPERMIPSARSSIRASAIFTKPASRVAGRVVRFGRTIAKCTSPP